MTPSIARETVVEYHFQCFCGAPIVAAEKTTKCPNCGETLGIRRVKRQHWKIAPRHNHGRLQPAGLREFAIRTFLFLLLGSCLYLLGQWVYDLLSS
jgi:hypothetical protein